MSVTAPYVPIFIYHPDPANLQMPRIIDGHGAPDNSIGNDGDLYWDLDNSILYGKADGAWDIASGSTTVTGGGTVIIATVDPEGVTTADPGAVIWNKTNETLWVKETGTGTNTGWIQIV